MTVPEEKVPLLKIGFDKAFNNDKLNLEKLQQSKFNIMAMVGVKSDGTQLEQQNSIKEFLGLELFEAENFIQESLDSEKSFFIIEKHFWDNWSG